MPHRDNNGTMELTRIMVVDDEPGIRDLFASELRARGYQVVTANNGQEAVEKAEREKFDLVISDIKMPRMGGLEMLDQLKKIDPDIEVIISTGYGTVDAAVCAMKRGAYDFIQKPFNLDEILALVDKALEKSELKAILGIYEASRAVFSSMEIDSLLPLMAALSIQVLKADDASIMLRNPEGHLTVAAASGLKDDERKQSRLALGERIAGKVALSKAPVIINGPAEEDPRFAGTPSLRDIYSAIVFPLVIEGEVIGVLNANRTVRRESFTIAEMRHATIFCSQIAQALHNAKLYSELKKKNEEIQAMQAQLIQSEKLAAVGKLAAGVAHEINNPLTGIMGFTEILLQDSSLTAEQRGDLECILHQGKRCRNIVQDLMTFSRKKTPKREPVELTRILAATVELVQRDFQGANVAIQRDIPDEMAPIYGDPTQLEQVFINCFTNARHAMEGRADGRLMIRARRASDRIILRFEDNGCGIAQEHLDKVFDPFFTTKPVGIGTGLGLSISREIVQQHEGVIRIESKVGVGTAIVIELPLYSSHEKGEENIGR